MNKLNFTLLILSFLILIIPKVALGDTIFTETFEGAFPGTSWTVGDSNATSGLDYWDDTSYKYYAGSWSGWCAMIGDNSVYGGTNYTNHKYDTYMDAYMYRSVSLGSYTSAMLSYKYWLDSESGYDKLYVIYYNFGGWNYVDMRSGNSGGWQSGSVSVPTSATIVGLHFYSNLNTVKEGAYIDDITLTASAAQPDLSITGILISLSTVYYAIQNQGAGSAAASTSYLWVDGYNVSSDSVPALGASGSSEESFSSYSWSCSGTSDTIQVCADGPGFISESNETNNCLSQTQYCAPAAPTLLSPSNGQTSVSVTPTLDWNDVIQSGGYYYVSYKKQADTVWSITSTITPSQYTFPSVLANDTVYQWYVTACNLSGPAGNLCSTSATWTFTTVSACSTLNFPTTEWQRVWYVNSTVACLGNGPNESSIPFDTNWGTGTVAYGRSDDIRFLSGRTINIPTAGTYRIYLGSDDGSILYIDAGSTLTFNKWSGHGYPGSPEYMDVYLTAGNHSFELDYYEDTSNARVSFSYSLLPCSVPANLIWGPIDDIWYSGRIKMSWDAVSGAQTYRLEWCQEGYNFGDSGCCSSYPNCYFTTSNTYAEVYNLTPCKSHSFRVRVQSATGCGAPGDWRNLITPAICQGCFWGFPPGYACGYSPSQSAASCILGTNDSLFSGLGFAANCYDSDTLCMADKCPSSANAPSPEYLTELLKYGNGAQCNINVPTLDLGFMAARLGLWDASEYKCIRCSGKLEDKICGDAIKFYTSPTQDVCTKAGNGKCEAACGAELACDEKYGHDTSGVPDGDPCGTEKWCNSNCQCVPIPKPDLVITKIWDFSETDRKVHYDAANQGTALAGASNSSLYVDDVYKDYDDVSSLAAGDSSINNTFNGWTCTPGQTYSIKVCADKDNVVIEKDETNNCLTKTLLCPGKPDLIIPDIWPDGSIVKYKIKNQGDVNAGASDTFLSVDGVYKVSDPISSVNIGEEKTSSFSSYNWVTNCTGASDTIKVCADGNSVIDEKIENNNCTEEVWNCGCLIGGTFYNNGDYNPSNKCQKCDISQSKTAWTNVPDGTDPGNACDLTWTSCDGICQKRGGNGYCYAGVCDTNRRTGYIETAGRVCSNGSEVSPSASINCDKTINCVDNACSAARYYRGCTAGATSCTETGKVSYTAWNAPSNYTISETTYKVGDTCTTNQDICGYSDYNKCGGVGSPYSCQKGRDIYRCNGAGSCAYDIDDNWANVAAGKVCVNGAEIDLSCTYYCGPAGNYCTGDRYKGELRQACGGAGSCNGTTLGCNNIQDCGATSNTCSSKCQKDYTYTCSAGSCSTYHTYTTASQGYRCENGNLINTGSCATSAYYARSVDKCDKKKDLLMCNGTGATDNDCNSKIGEAYDPVLANKIANTSGLEVDASSTDYADGICHNCAEGSCSGTLKWGECDSSGNPGPCASYNQPEPVYAQTGYTLTSNCETTGTANCDTNFCWDGGGHHEKCDRRCNAGHTCDYYNCVNHCTNGIRDCDETGKDCGGSCPACIAPTTTIQCNGTTCSSGWYTANVSIILICTPGAGAVCSATYYCTDQANTCTPATQYIGAFILSTEGTNYVRFYSVDNLGNTETPPKSQQVKLDKTKPTSQITSPPAGSGQSSNFSVSVTDIDTGGSGLATCYFHVYDSVAGWTKYDQPRTCSSSFPVTVGSGQDCRGGTCTVYVYAYDNAGWQGDTNSRAFNIVAGITAPTVVILPPINITPNSATLRGRLDGLGGASSCDVWFEYGTTVALGTTACRQSKSSLGEFSCPLTGLTPGTKYFFVAKAQNSGSW